ncbi:hypothetical protein GCM10028818_42860 [Spirosoma horti]
MAAINIILPVYNGEKYIKESVNSMLNQTFTDFVLYVIDDGSNDRTVSVLNDFNDKRLRVVQNGKNEGLINALNKGLELSRDSTYIARMDADDISMPNRLQVQYDFLQKNKQISLLGSAMDQFGEGVRRKIIYRPQLSNRIISTFLFYNPISHPTVMLRTEKLNKYYSAEFPKYEDYHLWISMCQEIGIYNLNNVLLKYRRHATNVTSTYYDNVLLDHNYIQKLLGLFAFNMSVELSSEEIDVLSIISTNIRYKLNTEFDPKYLQFINYSISNKLSNNFDVSYFNYLFNERTFLYFLSLKKYENAFKVFANMKKRNKGLLFKSYFVGKKD